MHRYHSPERRASQWREVPQARFFSWSDKMQLAYCAARDEDAARDEPTCAGWYLWRANSYREMMHGSAQ